jgi:hypothetical protein
LSLKVKGKEGRMGGWEAAGRVSEQTGRSADVFILQMAGGLSSPKITVTSCMGPTETRASPPASVHELPTFSVQCPLMKQ